MATFFLKKMLGGVGNGLDVPSEWDDGVKRWIEPGGEGIYSDYEKRPFFSGPHVYYVWTEVGITKDGFFSVMWWHQEMSRNDLIEEQKKLINDSMQSASAYTNVIMVVGFAALFGLWTQTKSDLHPALWLIAGSLIGLAALLFVGWELFGMVARSLSNIALAKAVSDPAEFERRMLGYEDARRGFMRRFYPVWAFFITASMALGLIAFMIMLLGMLNSAVLHYLRYAAAAAGS